MTIVRAAAVGLAVSFGCIAGLTATPAPGPGRLIRKAPFGIPLGRLLAQARAVRPGKRSQSILLDSAENDEFLIPVAGAVQGADGTYFHSDVSFANFLAAPQDIAVYWLPEGADGTNAPDHHFVIPAETIETEPDFVASQLNASGLGSIVVLAVDSKGNFQNVAAIDGTSRIWTYQPGSTGTVSLSLPAVSQFDSQDDYTAYTYGLRQDAEYRTNVGIVNFDSVAHEWTVGIVGSSSPTFTVTVPPVSMMQVPIPAGDFGYMGVWFQPDLPGFTWSAYSASVDNVSGDGWVEHARQ
jgi:hypothetical protein